jgi:hypothetical protein
MIKFPRQTARLDGTGKFLIPGLHDMHVHIVDDSFRELFLAHGVTSVRHMFTPDRGYTDSDLRAWGTSRVPAARLTRGIGMLDGPHPVLPWFARRQVWCVKAEEQARQQVRQLHRQGADHIKVYTLLPRDFYLAAAREANELGVPLVGHVPLEVPVLEAVKAGQRSIEHMVAVNLACFRKEKEQVDLVKKQIERGDLRPSELGTGSLWLFGVYRSYDDSRAQSLFRALAQHRTWVVPTLIQKYAWGRLDDRGLTKDERLSRLPLKLRLLWSVQHHSGGARMPVMGMLNLNRTDLAECRRQFERDLRLVKAMHDAGVWLLAGSDTPSPYSFPGSGLHDELELLVTAGLSPLEALRTATRNAAEYLGKSGELGSVDAGKLADLVLLDANPLDQINNVRKVHAVILAGRLVKEPPAGQRGVARQ